MQSLDIEDGNNGMTIFGSYEDDYLRSAREINSHINSLQSESSRENYVIIYDALAHLFEVAEGLVRGMEVEVRSMKGPDKKRCQMKSQQYKNDLLSLRKAFNISYSRIVKTSQSGESSFYATRAQRLQAGDESLQRTAAILQDSQIVLAETEDIGSEVLLDLESQGQSLLRANENVNYLLYDTVEAREVLEAIELRGARHRLFLYCIIFALVCANALALYFRLR